MSCIFGTEASYYPSKWMDLDCVCCPQSISKCLTFFSTRKSSFCFLHKPRQCIFNILKTGECFYFYLFLWQGHGVKIRGHVWNYLSEGIFHKSCRIHNSKSFESFVSNSWQFHTKSSSPYFANGAFESQTWIQVLEAIIPISGVLWHVLFFFSGKEWGVGNGQRQAGISALVSARSLLCFPYSFYINGLPLTWIMSWPAKMLPIPKPPNGAYCMDPNSWALNGHLVAPRQRC